MITIVKGDDRSINLYFVQQDNGRPYDLTGFTNISVFFKTQFGGILEKNNSTYDTAAYASYAGINFTAQTLGTTGNSISLVFDGIQSLQTIVNAWNLANSGNQVSHDAPDGSIVPASATVSLAHGQSGLIDVTVPSAVLGHVVVRVHDFDTVQFLAGRSLSFKVFIDNGTPPEGTRRKVIFANALEVVEDNI